MKGTEERGQELILLVYGRLPVYAFTIILASLFELGCALAPNMPALIVLRFIAGFFSAAPLSNGVCPSLTPASSS